MSTASLSLLASYDELVRCTNTLVNGSCEGEFLQFAVHQEEMRQKWLAAVLECQRLHSSLEKAQNETSNLERHLSRAKQLLESEKRKRRIVEEEKKILERQISLARDLLLNDGGRKLNDETREKLQSTLNGRFSSIYTKDSQNDKLNTIEELDSTASILGDLSSFSKSDDDLDSSVVVQHHRKREWKDHKVSPDSAEKKRRTSRKTAELNTSDRIVATTTVVMPKDGTITASSVIEALPASVNAVTEENKNLENIQSTRKRKKSTDRNKSSENIDTNNVPIDITPSAPKEDIMSDSESENMFKPSPNIAGYYTINSKSSRGHTFTGKTTIKTEICGPCGKRIRFGKVALKCRECRATTHAECKDMVPLPCVPAGNTPTSRRGSIADFTPIVPPMVPSLVVHCINEIELRGMSEQGLYRISGGTNEVKSLKEKFLRGKGAPNLSEIDINTICSTLKDFLRSLREPLITIGLWTDFARAVAMSDNNDSESALYQAISELPQPNRDTLAFLILHLQRVSSSLECKMPISNLAKIFGPTLVGYSCQEPSPTSMLDETKDQVAIVEALLKIPSDYWANFVNPEIVNNTATPKPGKLKHTPSTESLLKRTASRAMFQTPLGVSRSFLRKNRKYFASPSKY